MGGTYGASLTLSGTELRRGIIITWVSTVSVTHLISVKC